MEFQFTRTKFVSIIFFFHALHDLKLHRRYIPTCSINRTCPDYTQTRKSANKTMLRFHPPLIAESGINPT
jgi:hypothetical protein